MEDYFDLPNINSNVSVFYACGSTTWQVWNKPKNSKFIMITCIGGGGGGGGGQSGAGTNRTGGGGGGASANWKGIYPSIFVPDVLYVNVGVGGSGGTANNSGGTGSISYVTTSPFLTGGTVLMLSTVTNPAGGLSTGTGGSSGNPNLNSLFLTQLSVYQGTDIIRNGAAGGASSGGTGTNAQTDYALCPGAGGGGASSTGVCGAGGNIVLTNGGVLVNSQYPTISGGTASGTTRGGDGTKIMMPNSSGYITALASLYGGAGGGGNGTAAGTNIGGDGGDGYYGCGGGGGGAGDTGGNGGKGGDGFVMIISY